MSDARWVDETDELVELVKEIQTEAEYAIDTEFLRERTYYPRLALIQLGWSGGIALIDPLTVDLAPLCDLLASDAIAIFHAADQDLEVLELACGTVPRRMFDTQLAAGFLGFSTPSLSSLTERIVGVHMSKGDRLTDWTQRPLTEAQKLYAAGDVAHLIVMKARITEQLESTGRLEWVEEETELLRKRSRGVPQAERAWWKLKDGRVLRGRDRLVAQELCAWRERRAQHEDRPVRFVLPDLGVMAIAQAKPTTNDALVGLRGLDGRYTKGSIAREILDAVQRAIDSPPEALVVPEPEDFDRRLRPALTLVSAWIGQLARDAKLDASLLATRSDLVSFLRGDTDARLARGWRGEVVGAAVKQLVSGSAALAFEPNGALVLERRSGNAIEMTLAVPNADWIEFDPPADAD